MKCDICKKDFPFDVLTHQKHISAKGDNQYEEFDIYACNKCRADIGAAVIFVAKVHMNNRFYEKE